MSAHSRFRRAVSGALGAALFAGSALFASTALAQPADYSTLEADPAVWHLSDADSDVYIFGTFHILPPGLDWQTPGRLRQPTGLETQGEIGLLIAHAVLRRRQEDAKALGEMEGARR